MSTTSLREPSLLRAGAAVGLSMAVANLLQYALQLAAGRRLSTGDFGGFGALLSLAVIGAVPLLALQTVAARHIAVLHADREAQRARAGALLVIARRLGLVVTGGTLVLSPLVASFLHVPVAAALWLAVSLGPFAVIGAAQGVLQGRQQFAVLARLFLLVAALRVGGGVLGLLLVPDVTWGVAGTALGAVVGCAVALRAVRQEAGSGEITGLNAELRSAANGVLALLALTGVDLLVARHVLPSASSGRYAAGALVARACFWLPQFVAVLLVPRLASGQTALLRRAVALVAALGLLEAAAGVLLPRSGVVLLLGDRYASLTHRLGLFAAVGACLAVLQLLLYAEIAQGGRVVGRLLWACVAAIAAGVLVTRPALTGIVLLALGCTATTALVALWLVVPLRRMPNNERAGTGA